MPASEKIQIANTIGVVTLAVAMMIVLWDDDGRCRQDAPVSSCTCNGSTTQTATPAPVAYGAPQQLPVERAGEFVATRVDATGARVALRVFGDARVHGRLEVTELAVVGSGVPLTRWMRIFDRAAATECAGVDCGLHGAPSVLTDCSCDCDAGWSGAACSEFDCYGHGTYDGTGRCACDGAWEASTLCRQQWCRGHLTEEETCPEDEPEATVCSGRGVAVGSTCVCTTEGASGRSCEYVCATRNVGDADCRTDTGPLRGNWGHDMPPTSVTFTGVCGGGYTASPTTVSIGVLTCPPDLDGTACRARWDAEAPTCCAPGVSCTAPACGATDTGCCALLSAAACQDNGCALCPTVFGPPVCAARAYADTDCATVTWTSFGSGWTTWRYSCPSEAREPGTVCDPAARAEYLQMYVAACNLSVAGDDPIADPQLFDLSNATTACLAAARALINAAAWPELTTAYPSVGVYTTITAGGVPDCPTVTLGMLPSAQRPGSLGGPAVWTCLPDAAKQAFRVQLVPPAVTPTAPNLVAGTSMYIMQQDRFGQVYCLWNEPPTADEAAQLSAYDTAVALAVWRLTSYVSAADTCGAFRVDQDELLNAEWSRALLPNNSYSVGQAALAAIGGSDYYSAYWANAGDTDGVTITVHA